MSDLSTPLRFDVLFWQAVAGNDRPFLIDAKLLGISVSCQQSDVYYESKLIILA